MRGGVMKVRVGKENSPRDQRDALQPAGRVQSENRHDQGSRSLSCGRLSARQAAELGLELLHSLAESDPRLEFRSPAAGDELLQPDHPGLQPVGALQTE